MPTVKDDTIRRQQAQKAAEACIQVLKEQFDVRAVYIFGSLAGQSPYIKAKRTDQQLILSELRGRRR
jgi:predicted nucleotidyltransferase